MIRSVMRTKSIGAKVSEEEYARLEELANAARQSMGEWIREVLLEQAAITKTNAPEETVLAELLGLRTILLNLLFTVAKGEAMTAEQMQSLIARADAGKVERARKLLAPVESAAPVAAPAEMEVQ